VDVIWEKKHKKGGEGKAIKLERKRKKLKKIQFKIKSK
jgi:hypothetical protein